MPQMPSKAGAEAIKRAFDAEFVSGTQGTALPESALQTASGSFEENGWDVQYRFGTHGGVEYLDCFMSHRRTNDRMYRVYAEGRVEDIGSSTEGVLKDADRAFYDDARRRGFGGFV
jgi:hypothetical protein